MRDDEGDPVSIVQEGRLAWTGGQYTVFRACLGVCLLIQFALLGPQGAGGWSREPWVGKGMLVVSSGLSILLAIGWRDRAAAVILCAAWAVQLVRSPLSSIPGAPYFVCLLLAHAAMPPAPFGSVAAVGRVDPKGDWRFPPFLWVAAWLLLLGMHLWSVLSVDVAELSISTGISLGMGMVILHFFTFNPAWVKPLVARGPETLFYDGGCGLCHRAVRFVLAEDFREDAFVFAPLHGETFERMVPPERRAELPDSIVVVTEDGRVLTRSSAVIHILRRLGGLWRVIAEVARFVPAVVRDAAYDFIARIRSRIFAKPTDVCPVLPPSLRDRMAP
jgi:predicted DCC family thiol-disulfide oxidoreductase YuxK